MIINGKLLAQERETRLKDQVSQFVSRTGKIPVLVAVELTRDPGSELYLKLKRAAAARVGIEMKVIDVEGSHPSNWKDAILLWAASADGVFVQHPRGIDPAVWEQVTSQIPPEKDVDCLTRENQELVRQGQPRFLPATVKAIGYCLTEAFQVVQVEQVGQVDQEWKSLTHILTQKSIVILGRSPIVGQPLAWWFEGLGIKFELLHSKTKIEEKSAKIKNADVIISATGQPGIITGDSVKPGVVVIDVGSPVGDVDFATVSPKAAAITPVPGGVGPLTVVSLIENAFQTATINS